MGKEKTEEIFVKMPLSILRMYDLNSSEKLVLAVLCRYWPNPYWGTNESIAKLVGQSERNIEKTISKLAKKGKIQRRYSHRSIGTQYKTCRVIVPKCLSGRCQLDKKWIEPEQLDGQVPEHPDDSTPNKRSLSPEQMDDLLKIDKKINKKKMPSPLPALEQAPAFKKKTKRPLLSEVECKKRLDEQKKKLREAERKN